MESGGKNKGAAKNIVAGILAIGGAIWSGFEWFALALGYVVGTLIYAVSENHGEISGAYLAYLGDLSQLMPLFVAVFILLAVASFAELSSNGQVKRTGIILSVIGASFLLCLIAVALTLAIGYESVPLIILDLTIYAAYLGLKAFCIAADWKKAFGNGTGRLT